MMFKDLRRCSKMFKDALKPSARPAPCGGKSRCAVFIYEADLNRACKICYNRACKICRKVL